jgi:hypothetical protein
MERLWARRKRVAMWQDEKFTRAQGLVIFVNKGTNSHALFVQIMIR